VSLFTELRRRNVFRVAAGYVVVSWVIIQVVSALTGPLNLPPWFETVVIVLLGIGFLLALVFAWAFELTPDGIKLTETRDGVAVTGVSKLDYALIAGLVLVAGVSLLDGRSTNTIQSATAGGSRTIAVLPFRDMSPDGDQEYFGDGIADELINELARLEGLRVASRTSSFSFKDSAELPQGIGEALGVRTLLEGSVRIIGDRVDVRARLIGADDGFEIWSDDYESELTDIFAIQRDIASSVAGRLGVTLGVGGVNSFRGAGTTNIDAYQAYLQGLALGPSADAIRYFRRAVELDENYAAAWSQLGLRTSATQFTSPPEQGPAIRERALGYVRHAVELDPDSAQAHLLLGSQLYSMGEYLDGEREHLTALEMLDERFFHIQYGNLLNRAGRSTDAIAQYDRARELDGTQARAGVNTWAAYVALGRERDALDALAQFQLESDVPVNLLTIALNFGDIDDIRPRLAAMPENTVSTTALYAPILEVLDSPVAAIGLLHDVYEDRDVTWPSKGHDIAMLAAYFDEPELALEAIAEELRFTRVRLFGLWYPHMARVRQLPAFKDLVTELNLVTYWRASGWADACAPRGSDDFTCS